MSRARRWLVILGICLAAFAGLCALLIYIGSRDEAPPDTSDLAVEWEEIPPEQNALTYLRAAAKLYVVCQTEGDYLEMDYVAWPQDATDKYLADNAPVFVGIDKALACRSLVFPPALDITQDPSSAFDLLTLCRLLALRASDHFRNGRPDAAFEDTVRMMRLARLMEKGKGGVVANLVGLTCGGMALERMQFFLPKANLDAARLRQLANEVGDNKPRTEDMAEMFRVEYQMQAHTIDSLEAGKFTVQDLLKFHGQRSMPSCPPPSGYALKPNATKRMCAESIRGQLDALALPWSQGEEKRRQLLDRYNEQVTPFISSDPIWGRVPWSNKIGKVFNFTGARGLVGAPKLLARSVNEAGTTQILLALKAYKVEKGELPERVEDLVPAYLPALPVDVFDGRPLRYSRTKRIVYSVGEDMKDSGGMSKEEIRVWAAAHWDSYDKDKPDVLPWPWELPDPSLPIEF